jgi:hypothetical protein
MTRLTSWWAPRDLRMRALTLAACVSLAAPVAAQTGGGFDLTWYAIDGGGVTRSGGGEFVCGGTVGQPAAGVLSGADYEMATGFWAGVTLGSTTCDGQVTIDDLVLMVNIARGSVPIGACPNGDSQGDGVITVDDLLSALNNDLDGCH